MTKNTLPQEPEVDKLKKQTDDVEWLMKSGIDEKPKELMFFFYLFMSLIFFFFYLFFFSVLFVFMKHSCSYPDNDCLACETAYVTSFCHL